MMLMMTCSQPPATRGCEEAMEGQSMAEVMRNGRHGAHDDNVLGLELSLPKYSMSRTNYR